MKRQRGSERALSLSGTRVRSFHRGLRCSQGDGGGHQGFHGTVRAGARLHTPTLGRAADDLLGPQRSPREAVLPATPSCFPCGGQAIAPKSAARLTHCPGRTWGRLLGAGRGPSKGTNGSSSLLSRASSGERLRSGDTRTASGGGPPPARRRQPGRETGRPLPSPYAQTRSGLQRKVQPAAPWAARRQRRRTVPFLGAKMTRRQGLHLQAQRSAMVPREQ